MLVWAIYVDSSDSENKIKKLITTTKAGQRERTKSKWGRGGQ